MKHLFTLSSLLLLVTAANLRAQGLSVPILFNDHMVLQRDVDVRIWGKAKPGAVVAILFNNQDFTTTANADSSWETYLPKHAAGGPYSITVESGNSLTFEDVWFGDVWVAGGQSNMEWKLSWIVNDWEYEVANSDIPEIRFFEVPNVISSKPEYKVPGGEWKIANPQNSPEFSAVAWHFAKLNHAEKGVPIGIIDSNWGGTPAESWVPAQRLLTVEGYQEEAGKYLDADADWDAEIAENAQRNASKYQRVQDQAEFLNYGVHESGYNDSNWEDVELPNEAPLLDFVWLRKKFTLNEALDAKLSFGNPGKFTVAFINGQQVYTKTWNDEPRVIEVDSSLLKQGENVIAIRTVEDWNNLSFIGRAGDLWLATDKETINLEGTWKFSNTIEPPMPEVVRYENEPAFLYNAMIHPIAGYSIKGAIWYQGESNAGLPQYYNELFEAMIEEWRYAWNQGDFPFLFVQLANFMQKYDDPTDSGWARLREAQTQTLSLANTGMATIIDIGDANDIHPRNKKDVGYRLWLAAEKVAFGKNILYSGPMYRGHVVEDDKITISFDHVGSGLMSKGARNPSGFAVAGSDSVFYWAETQIVENNKIEVRSDQVPVPVAVRYAWADNPNASLYNKEGLPAVPFRTDDW